MQNTPVESIPAEIPEVEGLTTELLEDGRVIYTITKEALIKFKPEIVSTQFENVDTGDISFLIQFRLIDPEAEPYVLEGD